MKFDHSEVQQAHAEGFPVQHYNSGNEPNMPGWVNCHFNTATLENRRYRAIVHGECVYSKEMPEEVTLTVSNQLHPAIVTAPDLLVRAANIMAERGRQYDKPSGERSMTQTVRAFNIITGHGLTDAQGWLFMETLKNVRAFTGETRHVDSLHDGIAYSALKAEAALRENACAGK